MVETPALKETFRKTQRGDHFWNVELFLSAPLHFFAVRFWQGAALKKLLSPSFSKLNTPIWQILIHRLFFPNFCRMPAYPTCGYRPSLIMCKSSTMLWTRHGSPQGLKMPSLRIWNTILTPCRTHGQKNTIPSPAGTVGSLLVDCSVILSLSRARQTLTQPRTPCLWTMKHWILTRNPFAATNGKSLMRCSPRSKPPIRPIFLPIWKRFSRNGRNAVSPSWTMIRSVLSP